MEKYYTSRILFLCFIAVILSSCKSNSVSPGPEDGTVFFKVGEIEMNHNESFIIALTDSLHIAQARNLIKNPDSSIDKIVVAKIVRQDGNEEFLNKDLNQNKTWSWKVDSLEGFGFNTIEILDGWPGYIEEDINRWFRNTSGEDDHGFIGFWNYTVVAEVDASDLK